MAWNGEEDPEDWTLKNTNHFSHSYEGRSLSDVFLLLGRKRKKKKLFFRHPKLETPIGFVLAQKMPRKQMWKKENSSALSLSLTHSLALFLYLLLPLSRFLAPFLSSFSSFGSLLKVCTCFLFLYLKKRLPGMGFLSFSFSF
jgi:hypothetical protein